MHWLIFIAFIFILIQLNKLHNSIQQLEEKLSPNEDPSLFESKVETLLCELSTIVEDMKKRIDVGLPIWKREYPWFWEHEKDLAFYDGSPLQPFIAQSVDIIIQGSLVSISESMKDGDEMTFFFKKINKDNSFRSVLISSGFGSFLSIQETILDDKILSSKYRGLSGTNLTEYFICEDDAFSQAKYNPNETIILEKGLIQKIYNNCQNFPNIVIEEKIEND